MASFTIGRRFTQLIQHLGISKNAFAQSLGKTATVIQHLVDERNKPGYDLLCKVFEVYPDVSKDWLLLGQGPMLLTSPGPAAGTSAKKAGVGTGAQATLPLSAPPAPAAAAVSVPAPVAPAAEAEIAVTPAAAMPGAAAQSSAAAPLAAQAEAPLPTPRRAAEAVGSPLLAAPAEIYLTAALHAQHLQHQLALAEQRNQHLLEQQRLMQQLLDLAQRR